MSIPNFNVENTNFNGGTNANSQFVNTSVINNNVNVNNANTAGGAIKTKDINKPKGAMSSYSCFTQVIREEYKKRYPTEQVDLSEFSKKCAERWKQMTPKMRKQFEDMASADRDRFNREMNIYDPPGPGRRLKKKALRDPNQPKKSLSAFFFYCEEYRPEIRDAHPEWRVAEIAKELGKRWETCQEKHVYEQRAKDDKRRYDAEMLDYRAGNFVPGPHPHVHAHLHAHKSAKLEMSSTSGDANGGGVGEDGEEADASTTLNDSSLGGPIGGGGAGSGSVSGGAVELSESDLQI